MNGNPRFSSSSGVMRVPAPALIEALASTCVGRSRSETAALRVEKTRAAVVRVHDGLVVRARFTCDSSGAGVFLLPPQTTDLLADVTGELEIAFERIGNLGRVRISSGQSPLLDHTVTDRRLATLSASSPPEPSGVRMPAGPLAFALRQARDFLDRAAMRGPEHSVVYLGPLPGTEHPVVLARDEHSAILMLVEGLAPANLRIPVAHLGAIARFLGQRDSVIACASGPRFALVDDEGSMMAWQCAINARLMSVPPTSETVTIDQEVLLAAIDRLLAVHQGTALQTVLTLEPNEHRLTLFDPAGRASEIVDVVEVSRGRSITATVQLRRLRSACDTASRQVHLHVNRMFVLTVDRGLVNARGRRVQRPCEGTVPMVTYRIMATMARGGRP